MKSGKELEKFINSMSDFDKDLLELWYVTSVHINRIIFSEDEEIRLKYGKRIRDIADIIKEKYEDETSAYHCLTHCGFCIEGIDGLR